MANLAIKGHATRGEEVIELLGMLGGSNAFEHIGNNPRAIYYIDETYTNFITCSEIKKACDCIIFTLEEFLEKYPYKVMDKVYNVIHNENQTITGLVWDVQDNKVCYQTNNNEYVYVNYLQPYKEAPMYLNGKANKQSDEIKKTIEPVKEIMEETNTIDPTTEINLNHSCFWGCNEIELIIPDGWEFKQRDNKMFGIRKQPYYPKTYKECQKILKEDVPPMSEPKLKSDRRRLVHLLEILLTCRDAYWKIAGEEMGLGKPWAPDWNTKELIYIIYYENDKLWFNDELSRNTILAFPTEEMRDAFYENFKDLIEECKEFL